MHVMWEITMGGGGGGAGLVTLAIAGCVALG